MWMSAGRGAFVGFGALSVAVALTMTACSSGGKPKATGHSTAASQGPGGDSAPLQSQALMYNPKVRLDLLALDRVSDKVVVARIRVINQDDADFPFSSTLGYLSSDINERNTYDPGSVSKISLVDAANSRRYFPLVDTARNCLCTRDPLGGLRVPAGRSIELWAAFPGPPPGTGRMALLFPEAPPFLDVPVGNRPGGTIEVEFDHPAIDPVKIPTASPRITRIISTVESSSGAQEDNGTDLSVRISTDVLFALNRSDLSPQAQDVLKTVGAEIDRSPGTTVKIDGYTDNSGNDAINNPLSTDRARSVEAALTRLVTRSGVSYQSQGHGSADPIASNDTDQGRQKNRRVTVTFARPKPQATPTPPAVSSTASGSGAPLSVIPIEPDVPGAYVGTWPHKANVAVNGLRRGADGYAVLTFTVHNDDAIELKTPYAFNAVLGDGYRGFSTSGVTLTSGDLRYRALRDDRGDTLGPDLGGAMLVQAYTVYQGKNLTLTTLFKIPGDVKTVTVDIPGFGKAQNISMS